jgi:hypothetical protein
MTPVTGRNQARADGARYFTQSPGLRCPRGDVSYALIVQHQETWPLAVWCEVLAVSRRGLYADAQRHAAPRMDRDEMALRARGQAMHAETGHRDGSRRLAKPLQAEGDAVGRDNARRLRPPAGVAVRRRKRGPVTPDRRHGDAVAPQLWARQVDVAPPDTVWGELAPPCGRQQGGRISRCCGTCMRARWWAGRGRAGWMPPWCRPRWAWRWGAGVPRPG